MFLPTDQALAIDIRTSAEVMLYGVAEDANAHIPYYGGPIDEWNVFQQSYLTHGNTSFINGVFDLIREYGLYRDSSIVLITKSNRKGLRAASLLQVAGYKRVRIENRVGNSDGLVELAYKKHVCNCEKEGYIVEGQYPKATLQ
ncbi:MAG: hypothetical protein N0C81_02025 [Candidatus Thiodiazotropha lotti]|nr:hypothetical protein [Candidatus Thiodiazotropha lotti]MCG8005058.1 hypothetical protein [Candidatus Thiodiazotropha lotti]MCG8006412.1 hypothetical protein [Candidatus Thiodiazotropha lotti]MCW4188686.1 hypothetical protein [Candidatus Thiodiazotropha lotti]MCW4193993.1 hypothetical protein [Candidatus Thiodiazotropha lotti]